VRVLAPVEVRVVARRQFAFPLLMLLGFGAGAGAASALAARRHTFQSTTLPQLVAPVGGAGTCRYPAEGGPAGDAVGGSWPIPDRMSPPCQSVS
jgi:hypothetical protein